MFGCLACVLISKSTERRRVTHSFIILINVSQALDSENLRSQGFLLTHNAMRYDCCFMIESFKCKETEKIYRREYSKKLPTDIQDVAFRKLRMLNRSSTIQDLRIPPANRLEALTGNRKGQHSIRINQQWRICFEWKGSNAYNVVIVDYH